MYKLKRSIYLFNYRLIIDPHNVQLPVGLIAPLVERYTGIAKVRVQISTQGLKISDLSRRWLSSTKKLQIMIIDIHSMHFKYMTFIYHHHIIYIWNCWWWVFVVVKMTISLTFTRHQVILRDIGPKSYPGYSIQEQVLCILPLILLSPSMTSSTLLVCLFQYPRWKNQIIRSQYTITCRSVGFPWITIFNSGGIRHRSVHHWWHSL